MSMRLKISIQGLYANEWGKVALKVAYDCVEG